MENIAIIIPALEPNTTLLDLLAKIRNLEKSPSQIIVINDGSSADYDEYFKKAKEIYNAIVLTHDINYGKGKALKTAFKYILENMPEIIGAITIDSDGQHTYEDMTKCAKKFHDNPESLVLGVRDFQNKVPLKSKFGNTVTRQVLWLTTGINLEDTQTGLRVIPRQFLQQLIDVNGDRFEFELNMIMEANKIGIEIIEVPIATIYHDDNAGTHFRAVNDSIAIYNVMFRFALLNGYFFKYAISSILSFIIDITIFTIVLSMQYENNLETITLSTVIARIVSSVFNYSLNRFVVFKEESGKSFVKYALLVILQMLMSSLLVTVVNSVILIINVSVIKVFVDIFLFIASYYVQKHFIFKYK